MCDDLILLWVNRAFRLQTNKLQCMIVTNKMDFFKQFHINYKKIKMARMASQIWWK